MAAEIRVPRLGWSMEEGTFVGWKKRDGDAIAVGEILYELEGEKASQEIESLDAGVLRIAPGCPAAGTVVPVGALLGCVVAAGEVVNWASMESVRSAPAESAPAALAGPSAAHAPPSVRRLARELGISIDQAMQGRATAPRVQSTAKPTSFATDQAKSSPRARRAARERGIDWRQLPGSGRNGRVRERDVLAAAGISAPVAGEISIPITPRRRTIAQRMVQSLQRTAPVTLTTRVDVTRLVEIRAKLKAGGVQIVPAYGDLIAQHVVKTLEKHPLLAGRWEENRIVLPQPGHIHVGIAVDTDDGLLVPVLRDVAALSIEEIARQSRDLVERARANKLTAAEMQGAVFTITNLGAYGIDAFTPIIHWPQSAILGMCAIRREPVFDENDRVVARHLMTLSLTFDHRVIDGAPAARFMADLVAAIEQS
ncbi:MAG TPA: dihydrolipoamide acetyltransferase family protein [Pirellulaceae bacterium]|nr:dihydrolipoamide acetyltransferase family protein [Pirellulaceae bacterium]